MSVPNLSIAAVMFPSWSVKYWSWVWSRSALGPADGKRTNSWSNRHVDLCVLDGGHDEIQDIAIRAVQPQPGCELRQDLDIACHIRLGCAAVRNNRSLQVRIIAGHNSPGDHMPCPRIPGATLDPGQTCWDRCHRRSSRSCPPCLSDCPCYGRQKAPRRGRWQCQ